METNGMFSYTVSATPTQVCEFCGENHYGPRCHYVKKLERYESGSVKMVEFFSAEEMNPARYGNVPYVSPQYPRSPWFDSNTPMCGPYVTSETIATRDLSQGASWDNSAVSISDAAMREYEARTMGYGTSGGTFDFTRVQDYVGRSNDAATREALVALLQEVVDPIHPYTGVADA